MINYEDALEKVRIYLNERYSFHELSAYQKNKLGSSDYQDIWGVEIKIFDSEDNLIPVKIYLGFPEAFPVTVPSVFLAKESYEQFQFYPHIEPDQKVCLFTKDVQPNMDLPGEVVGKVISMTASVLENGIRGQNSEEYEEEFEAYWYQSYSRKDKIDFRYLVMAETPLVVGKVKMICLERPLQCYRYIIHQNESSVENFKEFLEVQEIKYKEVPIFFLSDVDQFHFPPFSRSNKQMVNFYQKLNQEQLVKLKSFFNSKLEPKVFLFEKSVEGEVKYLGWRHQSPHPPPGSHKTFSAYEKLIFWNPNENIIRIYPQMFSKKRLVKRSAGIENGASKKMYALAGLGSIGSNLIHFFKGINTDFRLIDTEKLDLENIGRHLLGFNYVGWNKSDALKDFLSRESPLNHVDVRNSSILKIVKEDVEFINSAQCLMVSIGMYNTEKFLAEALRNGIIKVPIFFFWVEPYLFGGHCLYLNPSDPKFECYYDEEGFFKFNVVKDYNNPNLTMKEAGCQSVYTPYSSNSILEFLGTLYPYIMTTLNQPHNTNSCSYTWIGNSSSAQELDIELSEFGNMHAYGEIIKKSL